MLDTTEEKVDDAEARLGYSLQQLLRQHTHETSISKSPAQKDCSNCAILDKFLQNIHKEVPCIILNLFIILCV
jgi:hypothetical protein